MKKTHFYINFLFVSVIASTAVFLSTGEASGDDVCGPPGWVEYEFNPVIDPDGGTRAYYPTVLYDRSRFSGHGESSLYKIWVDAELRYYTSDDGINWTFVGDQDDLTITGLPTVRHPNIEYFPDGFAGQQGGDPTMYYRLWYWDESLNYTVDDLRYAESPDGKEWYNDQVVQQGTPPLIDDVDPDWNRGTYGPCDVLYNPGAGNTGTDPFNYTLTMYYEGTSGGTESTGLAYSADGIFWTGYNADGGLHPDVVFEGTFDGGTWDVDYASFGSIIRDANGFRMWYSGGDGAINHGIGYATSADGIIWTRDADNPIFHKDDGIAWRSERTYTSEVLEIDGGLHMYFSGRGDGNYAVGYAYYYEGGCSISDGCYDTGEMNPYNVCEVCDIDLDTQGWSDNDGYPCDDALWCNGVDVCAGGDCSVHAGTPQTMCPDDGLFCTGIEYCDESEDRCGATGNPCADDGAFCNGTESCDEADDECTSSGNPCTDDGVFCNGLEYCDEVDDACASFGDPCVDDGAFCNGTESCNEANDECTSSGNPCTDDSLFCNGAEVCDENDDACRSTGNPCAETETCDEDTDTCTSKQDGGSEPTETKCDPVTLGDGGYNCEECDDGCGCSAVGTERRSALEFLLDLVTYFF